MKREREDDDMDAEAAQSNGGPEPMDDGAAAAGDGAADDGEVGDDAMSDQATEDGEEDEEEILGVAKLQSSMITGYCPCSIARGSVIDFAGDAVVNAANTGCLGGGGVDGAINRAAGPTVRKARRAIPIVGPGSDRCATGDARMTIAGDLACRWLIHAVGPMYYDDAPEEGDLLLYQAPPAPPAVHSPRRTARAANRCAACVPAGVPLVDARGAPQEPALGRLLAPLCRCVPRLDGRASCLLLGWWRV
jgi:hypothetical protein